MSLSNDFQRYINTASVNFRIKPFFIKFRRSTGISSASAYQFKVALGLLENMEVSERDAMMADPVYGPYAKELAKHFKVAKKETSNVLDAAKQRMIEVARPIIDGGKAQIRGKYTKYRNQVLADYAIGGNTSEFKAKYGKLIPANRFGTGGYYEMHKFWGSFIGRTLFNDEKFQEGLEKLCKEYEQGELDKIARLFGRIEDRVPGITNVHSEEIHGSYEFHMTLETETNSYRVRTEMIVAGGHNIQVIHNRWLVKILDNGTKKEQKFTI